MHSRPPRAGGRAAWALQAVLLLAGCAPASPGGTAPAGRATYALRGARILDLATGTYSGPSLVLVRAGRITRIGGEAEYRAGLADSTVDLSGTYLLPGLIDAHVHLGIGGPPAVTALADLRAGFTTVVDLGAVTHRILRLRDSINAGLLPGPRVLAAGLWVGIKGGVCEFGGIGIAGGAEPFRARIRENAAAGADVVKLCVSGWPAEAFGNPERYELPDTVLAASVAEAHAEGKLAVAHAISRGAVQASLRAGIDGLAHAAFLDSATAAAMRVRNTFMISTLASLTGSDTSAASRALRDAVRLAHRMGVRIVLGTDGGVLPHGTNAEEALALRAAGLSPLEVLRAATVSAATAFGLADSVGAIRGGMVADLIAVERDPLQDLAVLKQPRLVLARGKIVYPAGPSAGSASDAGVRAARTRWNAALAARDSSALARLVEDSAVHVSARFTHVGRAAYLSVFLDNMTARPAFRLTYEPERIVPCERPACGLATEYGRWRESWSQDGEATEVSGTYYAIWREHDGVWQIRSEVFATLVCRGRRYCS